MQTDNEVQSNRKIMHITLHELDSMIRNKSFFKVTHRNSTFHYVCFVARLAINAEEFVFNDGTGILTYDSLRLVNKSYAQSGHYYECLCVLKSMDTSFKAEILNLREVEGNFITTHFMRIMAQELQSRISEKSAHNEIKNVEQDDKETEVYQKMKEWSRELGSFTAEQIMGNFVGIFGEKIVNRALGRLEDEGTIGNMGDEYQFID